MRGPLTVAVAQPECVPFDVAANADTHAELVRQAETRVVLFPELSLTGYELSAPPLTREDARLDVVVEACAQVGALALIGAPMHGETGRAHISILAVSSGGVTVAYHKMWLSGGEPRRFAQGNTPSVLDVDGWRVGLAVSHDLIVPQHAAQTAEFGVHAYLAGTLTHAAQAREQEERAYRIAVEYGLWVAVASFAGAARGYPEAAGRSGIWGPYGEMAAQAGPEVGALARATLR